MRTYDLLFRYLPATLKANEGSMMKTVINKSFMSVSLKAESCLSGPDPVKMMRIPKIPKAIDA